MTLKNEVLQVIQPFFEIHTSVFVT